MGVCLSNNKSHEKQENFSTEDLRGIEKYFSAMPKRKAEIFSWLMSSEGPWKTPESFVEFRHKRKNTDLSKSPSTTSMFNQHQIEEKIEFSDGW